ncbi:MAG: NeuD/PglB/VioB family sugar acetyltransferase [Bacteroidia bacterium]|nr:NeuD/PglB/VioB family sugar acetyltransferase [Bacteroidia bacterium]
MNNKKIYIIGSGGFAKEVYFLIKEIGNYQFVGFIDIDVKEDVCFKEGTFKVLSESEFLENNKPINVNLALGIGNPKITNKIIEKFKKFEFPNLIHPSVVGDFGNIKFGVGNIITAGVIFTTGIQVGNFNIFNLSTTIGHDAIIGDYNVINPTVNISGGVEIGDNNLIGVGATILQYKKIGNNSIVGASSLVTTNVEDNTTVVGVPAKLMNKRI